MYKLQSADVQVSIPGTQEECRPAGRRYFSETGVRCPIAGGRFTNRPYGALGNSRSLTTNAYGWARKIRPHVPLLTPFIPVRLEAGRQLARLQ
jgi:hypothetical protein